MADGMTTTGLTEMKAGINEFPSRVTAALKGVAKATAARVKAHARVILKQKTHGTGETAELIEVVEDAANKQFRVISNSPARRPANLVLWIEHGTVKQPARPYMRPAAEAVAEIYRRDMIAASETVARDTFGD